MAAVRSRDLRAAMTTMPDGPMWLRCAAVYALFLLVAAPIGLWSGLLRPGAPHLTPASTLVTALLVFLQPALVEEIVFRGILLPRDVRSMKRGRVALVAIAALALYVAAHPLNAWLFKPPLLRLFEDPVYLLLAALLGLTCTAAYFISRSLWPPVVIHWLTVLTWIWFLGGQALLC